MCAETISEPDFLITELRYTLGQIHVQLGDVVPVERAEGSDIGTHVDQLLTSMMNDERRYQQAYSRMVNIAVPDEGVDPELRGHSAFERLRGQTVAMLEEVNQPWPLKLLDAVRQQVAADRQYATQLAEFRKHLLTGDQRSDLEQPLTRHE